MSSLFTIKSAWQTQPKLYETLAFAKSGDAILLIEDAVYSLQSKLSLASFLAKCGAADIDVFALEEDIQLRGVKSVYGEVAQIGYSGFVELVAKHERQIAW
jgi:sulfur relay protein TusB/DsrH